MNHGKHENTWISYDLLMINGLQGIPMGKHLKHMKNQKLSCPETKSRMDSASLFMRGPTSGWNCSCKSVVSWAYILILVVSSTQYIVIPCYTMLYHVIPCYTHGVYPNCTFKCQNPWIMVMSHEGEIVNPRRRSGSSMPSMAQKQFDNLLRFLRLQKNPVRKLVVIARRSWHKKGIVYII